MLTEIFLSKRAFSCSLLIFCCRMLTHHYSSSGTDSMMNPFQEGEDDTIPRSTQDSNCFTLGRAKKLQALQAMLMQIEALETFDELHRRTYDVWMIAWSCGVKMRWRGMMVVSHANGYFLNSSHHP
ncbi:hypothetical protein K7X08_004039 [Anisodus acutangulus]|uniref:Uncharacterized protein n=1 Tax=Anisodus acutangulus TaxID=402998 RepID=A0A9Q1RK87_9SOLA|nr:hypothetical protein K7X08_004039 [Anisodus acutangulus]